MRHAACLVASLFLLVAPVRAEEAPPEAKREILPGALAKHVQWMAAPERKGRGLWPDRKATADYIAKAFAEAGLKPLPGRDSMFCDKAGLKEPALRNVVAWLPGPKDAKAELSELIAKVPKPKQVEPVAREFVKNWVVKDLVDVEGLRTTYGFPGAENNIAKGSDQAAFGKGSIKGLAAPETANNAACTGSFVPLLTLGIPGSGTTAILLGALIALNVQPGPRLMVDNPSIFWAVIISMYIGNVVLLILNLPLIPYIAKVLAVPRNYLIPFILFFTLMGAYIGQNNATELLILVGFGVCATALKFADYPLAPLLIGFILGGMMEDNFARSMQLYDGIAFIWERPMTLGLLVIALLLVLLPSYRARRAKARAAGVADGD